MKQVYEIYTDGGYSQQHKKGGFAFVILQGEKVIKKASFPIENETNNRGELKAILYAIKSLPPKSSCIVYSDSQYAIGVLSKPWKPKANIDIIQEFRDHIAKESIKAEFQWVKGHNGNKWNEECDRMCNDAAGINLNTEYKKKKGYVDLPDTELLAMLKEINKELKRRNIL